ncbi:MAG: inositol phosphorylceramide synthase [Clostridia bacterium]|nr:inositol phosphorylceramide synthase [Clostridia bacterium]
MRSTASSGAAGAGNRLADFLLLAPLLAGLALYRYVGILTQAEGAAWVLKLPLDDRIPFIAGFIYIYYFWYLYSYGSLAVLLFWKNRGDACRKVLLSMSLTLALSIVVFRFFPTHVPRPEVTGDGPAVALVRAVYGVDPPYNCFPSIHVAFSVLTCLTLDALLRRAEVRPAAWRTVLRVVNVAAAASICLSTLYVKQHFSPDVAGGIAAALISWTVVSAAMRKADPVSKPRRAGQ